MSNVKKEQLIRVWIAIDLFDQIDQLIELGKYSNISDYLRDIIRSDLKKRKTLPV